MPQNKVSLVMDRSTLTRMHKKMNALKAVSQNELIRSMEHAAKNAVGRMKQDAPVDTGRLRREVEYKVTNDDIIITSEAIDPETKVDYAPIQEHGLGVPPQPYFFKNIRWMTTKLVDDISRKLAQVARKK